MFGIDQREFFLLLTAIGGVKSPTMLQVYVKKVVKDEKHNYSFAYLVVTRIAI